jgi:hypothetical protein
MKHMKYLAFVFLIATALFARTQASHARDCDQPPDCSVDGCTGLCSCNTDRAKCVPIGESLFLPVSHSSDK